MQKLYLVFISFFLSYHLEAQIDERMSESDIKIEDAFVEAKLHTISGHPERAIKTLDSLAKTNRREPAIQYELALTYLEMKENKNAENHLYNAINLDPNNIWYREKLANLKLESLQYTEVAEQYEAILKIEPKRTKYYDSLIDIYIKNNKPDLALKTLNGKELNTGSSEYVQLKKIEIYESTGNIKQALLEVDKWLKKSPKHLDFLKIGADLAQSNGMSEKAKIYYEQILKLEPTDLNAQIIMMDNENGKMNTSAFLLSLVPLLHNKDIQVDVKIKEILPFVEEHAADPSVEWQEALLQVGESIANTHPNEAKAHSVYADILMNSGLTVQAIRQYQRTLELNDKNFMVWDQLMYALEETQNFSELTKTAEKAIDYFPNQAISYYFAAVGYFELKNIKKSSEYVEEVELIGGKNPNIQSRLLVLKSKIAAVQNNKALAYELVNESLTISKNKNTTAMEWLGDLNFADGKVDEAKVLWNKALSLGSKSTSLVTKINQIQKN